MLKFGSGKILGMLILNTVLVIIYCFLVFMRTSVIIKAYGGEVNAIIQTGSQIFIYLALLEGGLTAAYLYTMYMPVKNESFESVASLYLGMDASLKKISMKMTLVLIPLCLLFATFMDIHQTQYFMTVLMIFLLGIRFIIPYYVSLAKKTLLIVYSYKYWVDMIDTIMNSVVIVIEMFCVLVLRTSIIYVLFVGIVFNFLTGWIYLHYTRKKFKQVICSNVEASYDAENMTKDIIIHQIGGLANNNIDTIILSMYDLTAVSAYQAYNTIISYAIQFLNRFSETFRASFGLKLTNGSKEVYPLFQTFMVIHVYAAMIILPTYLNSINLFISCWIGEEYILSKLDVLLFGAILLHRLLINPIYIIRDGMGLYRESKWYTVIQSIINLILSLLLVRPYGITGLLIGTIIPTYFFCAPCNYYLVFCKIFNKKIMIYIDLLFILISTGVSLGLKKYIYHRSFIGQMDIGWRQCIISSNLQAVISMFTGMIILLMYKKTYLLCLLRKFRK